MKRLAVSLAAIAALVFAAGASAHAVVSPPVAVAKELQQFTLSMRIYEALARNHDALEQVRRLRARLREVRERASQAGFADSVDALDQKAASLEGSGGRAQEVTVEAQTGLAGLNGQLAAILGMLQGADEIPATQTVTAAADLQKILAAQLNQWNEVKSKGIAALNVRLQQAGLPAIKR